MTSTAMQWAGGAPVTNRNWSQTYEAFSETSSDNLISSRIISRGNMFAMQQHRMEFDAARTKFKLE